MRQIYLTVLCLYKVNTVKQNRPLLTHALLIIWRSMIIHCFLLKGDQPRDGSLHSIADAPRNGTPRRFGPEVRAQATAVACSLPKQSGVV